LAWEIQNRGLGVQRQVQVPVQYKGHRLGTSLKIDLLIEKIVLIECKAASEYNEIFEAQMLTYLRLTGLKLGFVINFGEKLVKDGIHRAVNNL
jgi:GxxExxY protein